LVGCVPLYCWLFCSFGNHGIALVPLIFGWRQVCVDGWISDIWPGFNVGAAYVLPTYAELWAPFNFHMIESNVYEVSTFGAKTTSSRIWGNLLFFFLSFDKNELLNFSLEPLLY